MSSRVKRTLPLLKVLKDAKPKLRKAIIQYAPSDLLMSISEIILNMLKGVLKLTPKQKQHLSSYKKEFRTLARKDVSVNKKRKLLVQKGGGALATLLPFVLPILLSKI